MVLVVAVTALLSASVEFIEALTIVLAVGVVHGWRVALKGALIGIVALGIIVAVLGPAVLTFVPLVTLRLIIGGLLLLFGLKWLRKAILRYSGLKALHDEGEAFSREVERMQKAKAEREGLLTALNGTFLEGLEVVFIVLGFGTGSSLTSAVIGAAVGLVLVLVIGIALRAPLTRIPENAMKFVVGIMLSSFGTLWAGEGLGVVWPLHDIFVLFIVVFYFLVSLALISQARHVLERRVAA